MKTLPIFILLSFFFLLNGKTSAQESLGGPQIYVQHYEDSLYIGCSLNDEGCFYQAITLDEQENSRLFIHFSGSGPDYADMKMIVINSSGTKTNYYSKEINGFKLGTIDLDTTFSSADKLTIQFTSRTAGAYLHYTAEASYASSEAMTYDVNQNFCWKLGYLLKQSDNGYRFITGKDAGMFSYYATTPLVGENPSESTIEKMVGSCYFHANVMRGKKEDVEAYFKQMQDALQQCMGTQFEYKSTTDEDGYKHFVCTATASTSGQTINNWNYHDNDIKDVMTKYKVSLYTRGYTYGGQSYVELCLDVANLFEQY
jgi:hypothetical protein